MHADLQDFALAMHPYRARLRGHYPSFDSLAAEADGGVGETSVSSPVAPTDGSEAGSSTVSVPERRGLAQQEHRLAPRGFLEPQELLDSRAAEHRLDDLPQVDHEPAELLEPAAFLSLARLAGMNPRSK